MVSNLLTHFFFSCFLFSTLIHGIVQTLASACYNFGNTKRGDKHIYIAFNGQSACVITMLAMLYSILCSTQLHDNPLMFSLLQYEILSSSVQTIYEGSSKSFRTYFFKTLFIKNFKSKLRHFSI